MTLGPGRGPENPPKTELFGLEVVFALILEFGVENLAYLYVTFVYRKIRSMVCIFDTLCDKAGEGGQKKRHPISLPQSCCPENVLTAYINF